MLIDPVPLKTTKNLLRSRMRSRSVRQTLLGEGVDVDLLRSEGAPQAPGAAVCELDLDHRLLRLPRPDCVKIVLRGSPWKSVLSCDFQTTVTS